MQDARVLARIWLNSDTSVERALTFKKKLGAPPVSEVGRDQSDGVCNA